ncbi:hypothetical protein AWH56_000760 [Anaerobacillus isosaccharinicus]|uniref:Uncharacterized protein n=1 Tax=Anaerobacillus isosaccharinicus TaxID=1532552 RepID=A0A1S2LRD8_9BACI|nr:hypothetical protein [Anaerobacillus isosaccharinicus]MBA5585418.1 hypothetical protein [Anaerobacillus isosaccharinicus]QOY36263.1 hypothetical protein AWH56_000760 [Anaerobacillus isosaccharinicus]
MAEKQQLQTEVNELKTKVALALDRLKQLEDVPTYEKTENMINRSIESLPNEDKIIVIIQDTIKKENLVTNEVVEKKLSKLKLWLYVSIVGTIGIALRIFL